MWTISLIQPLGENMQPVCTQGSETEIVSPPTSWFQFASPQHQSFNVIVVQRAWSRVVSTFCQSLCLQENSQEMIYNRLQWHPTVYQHNFCSWEWQSELSFAHPFTLSTLTMCHTNQIAPIADNTINSLWVWPFVVSVTCSPISGFWRPRQTTHATHFVNGMPAYARMLLRWSMFLLGNQPGRWVF